MWPTPTGAEDLAAANLRYPLALLLEPKAATRGLRSPWRPLGQREYGDDCALLVLPAIT